MASFAQIDNTNLVVNVIVVDDAVVTDENGMISEQIGSDFLKKIISPDYLYLLNNPEITSRRNVANRGSTWRTEINAFQSPAPYPSWIFDDQTLLWNAPIPVPNDGNRYYWDETSQSWQQNTGE